MASNGEWQVVRRRRRFPDNWRTPSDVELDKVPPYIPYSTKPTFGEVVARITPNAGNTTGSANSGGSARPSPNDSRSSSPQTPPGTHYFHSPHIPTQLRFPPQPTFPEWRGRCFRCCRTGHTQAHCCNPRKCGKCWNNGHIASQCKTHMLNPAARPFQPKAHVYKPVRGEPMFDELLKGDAPPPKPTLPDGRPDKITVFIERDEAFFQEVESLGRAVVMYCANQPLCLGTHQVLKIAVATKLVTENEVKVSKLANEKFLIHLPVGLAVETFVSALPGYLWDQGFSFQQWSLLDDALVKMPRFKVLLDLVGLPPHQWKESSVVNAISKMGLFLGTVANVHASDLSARRVAIATDDLSNIPDNLALVIGGLEYPVQVKSVAWERGPIYSTSDFPVLPRRFSMPPLPPSSHEEVVTSEEGSDSDGQVGPNDDELIPCSRWVLREMCQGWSMSSIPLEIRAFINSRQGPAEISIGALEQQTTEDHAEYYNQAGQIVTADGVLVSTVATPEATVSIQRQSGQPGQTALSNSEDAHGDPNSCTPNGTRKTSILETEVGSVQGTDTEQVRKGKQPFEAQIICGPKTKRKLTLGLQKVDNQLAGPSTTRLIPQQTEGNQVKDHGSYGNPSRQVQPFSFPTSRHNRFREVLGRGKGRAGQGRASRHVASQDITVGRANSYKAVKRGSQLIRTGGNSLRGDKKKGSEAWLVTQAKEKYKWTRGAQSIPIEVINEAVGNQIMGQNKQAQKEKTILKRKPTSSTLQHDSQESQTGHVQRCTQEGTGSLHVDQQAQINLNPEAFFEVSVQKKLCLDIAKGCGLNLEVVTQTLQRGNDERRLESQQQGDLNQGEEEGPQVNLDPASDDELSAAEEY